MFLKIEKEINNINECPMFIPTNYLGYHCSMCLMQSKEQDKIVACSELSGRECPCIVS